MEQFWGCEPHKKPTAPDVTNTALRIRKKNLIKRRPIVAQEIVN
jgi:hypothetical protein